MKYFSIYFQSDIREKFKMQAKFMRRKFSGGYLLAEEGEPQNKNQDNANVTNKKVVQFYFSVDYENSNNSVVNLIL